MTSLLKAAAITLAVTFAGAAGAADLPSRKGPVEAPVYMPPAFTWTGFYVGANAGYGFGQATTNLGGSADMDGFIGGGQIGYNYQMGQFVLGLETDLQAADLGVSGIGGSIKTDYFGTVRARAGVAFDRFMPYITGGWAYGNVKTSVPALGISSDNSHTGGWALGGGVEYAITNNLIAGVEYLYVDLGEKGVLNNGLKVGTDFSVVRARLNYKF